jgi:hypothetical protein
MTEQHKKMSESRGVRCARVRSTRSRLRWLGQGTRRSSARVGFGRAHAPLAQSVDRLVGLGDGPMGPSPRVMNSMYIYIYIYRALLFII